MNELAPKHVLFSDVPTGGGDIGRRVAASLAQRPASAIYGLSPMQVVRRGGNRLELVGKPALIMLLLPGAAAPVSPARHEAVPITPPVFDQISRLQDRGLLPLNPDTVALSEALLVCSAGNGVTDWASFRAVAAALGATIGGSRVVCDAGFLARDRQVGASGISVGARCYLAFGISGAAQHLHGIADCESVIAVNSDPHAPIMNRADLAIVADAQTVLPALLQLLRVTGRRGPSL
jgi:electron transfer flavoprotein alpha subunit